jgi:hypothetical protein
MSDKTKARFTASVARLTKTCAAWTGDLSDYLVPGEMMEPCNPETVAKFIYEMRERLDIIERMFAAAHPALTIDTGTTNGERK